METKKLIQELHADNREWLNRLSFYEDEILFLQHQVDKIALNNTADHILALCESFTNRLLIQRNHIHELRDEVKMKERVLALEEIADPVGAETRYYPDEEEEREDMEKFEQIYADLKEDLLQFFSKLRRSA
jgi:uncharacterized damage-inducible protein DinB